MSDVCLRFSSLRFGIRCIGVLAFGVLLPYLSPLSDNLLAYILSHFVSFRECQCQRLTGWISPSFQVLARRTESWEVHHGVDCQRAVAHD